MWTVPKLRNRKNILPHVRQIHTLAQSHGRIDFKQHLTQGPKLGMLPLHAPHAPMSPTGRRFWLDPVSISHRANNIVLDHTPKISENNAKNTKKLTLFIQKRSQNIHCFLRLQNSSL